VHAAHITAVALVVIGAVLISNRPYLAPTTAEFVELKGKGKVRTGVQSIRFGEIGRPY